MKKEKRVMGPPIILDRYEDDPEDAAWEKKVEDARALSEEEFRPLVILNHPRLSEEERARRMEKIARAAAALIIAADRKGLCV